MIRQAHAYLVGAVSGATLIAIAIAAFVLLVSAQVFRDWPIAALGDSGGGSVGVSDARSASGGGGDASSSSGVAANSTATTAGANAGAGGGSSADGAAGVGSVDGTAATPTGQAGGGSEAGGGGSPASSAPASGSTPSASSGNSGSGSGSGGGGGGGSSGSGPAASTPSGKVAETVNDTVGTVDETVTGGALEKTGVTGVTEGVVNGVAGPESVVGKAVDETAGALGGILGGGK
jgi:hypothetical protein